MIVDGSVDFGACWRSLARDRRRPSAQSAVERGDYLVNTIMTCANCHSPKGPPAAIAGKDYSGGLRFDEPPFKVTAPNITPDKETGIGNWSDAEIKKCMLDRQAAERRAARADHADGVLSDPHRRAISTRIVAYLQTLAAGEEQGAPIRSTRARCRISASRAPRRPMTAGRPERQGQARLLSRHHRPLHGVPHADDAPAGTTSTTLGKGGREFPGPWGVSKSRNITSNKTAGIGDWTDAEIKTAITQGKRKDGTPLKGPMGYQYYAKMTDADLDAVVAYLRTVPAKE